MADVFRIFDDEWEAIVGIEQLSEHAHVQLECFLDEIGDNVEDVDSKEQEEVFKEEVEYRLDSLDQLNAVKKIVEKYHNEPDEVFTPDESKLALALRYFDVEEMDIH